jgi:hypothetical protein
MSSRSFRRKEVKTYAMPKQIKSAVLSTLKELGFEVEVKFEEEEEEGVVERFEKIRAYRHLPDLDTTLSVECYHNGKCYMEASRFTQHIRESVRVERLREAISNAVERLRQYVNRLSKLSEALSKLENLGFERFGRVWDRVEMSKRLNLERYSYARVYADPEHVLLQLQVEVPAEKIEKLVELVEKMLAEIEGELA